MEFHARELKYCSMLLWRKQNVLLQSVTIEMEFGSFGDADGYNGFVPSKGYLSSVSSDAMQNRPVAKLDKLVQGVEGEVSVCAEVLAVRKKVEDFFCEKLRKGNVVLESKWYISVGHRLLSVTESSFLPWCSLRSCS